jgi:hypothetical protein
MANLVVEQFIDLETLEELGEYFTVEEDQYHKYIDFGKTNDCYLRLLAEKKKEN